MMELMRRSIGGWVAKIFIGLLVLSFAVWGVSDAFIGGSSETVVSVGETEVDVLDYRLAYDQQVNALSRQFGTRITREQARSFGIEESVLAQLTSGAVLDENARRMGLGLSEDKLAGLIGDDPAFRDAAGRFSRQQLQLALRNIGMRETDYIENRKSVAIRTQIVDGVASNLDVPDAFIKALASYQNEKRVFDYVIISDEDVPAPAEPTDGDIEAYFEANKSDYVAPEYRTIEILKLEAEDIVDPAEVTDQEVADEYEATKSRFAEAEQRRIQQLVFSDREEAQKIADRLKAGEAFSTILQELGRDEASVELGMLRRADVPDPAIAEAAFSLELNETSDVVDGLFGPLVIRVSEIQQETVTPLEEASEDIRNRLALTKASDRLFEVHDRYEDERAAGATLQEAAETLGLEVNIVQSIDRRGLDKDGNVIPDLPESSELIRQAFDATEGVENPPINIGSDGFLWYEVTAIEDQRQRPLDEVRDDVVTAWKANEMANAVSNLASTMAERVNSGEELADVAADLLKQVSPVQNRDTAQDGELQQGSETGVSTDTQTSETTNTDTVTTESGNANTGPVKTSAPLSRTDTSSDLGEAAVLAGFANEAGTAVTAEAAQASSQVVMVIREVQGGSDILQNAAIEEQIDSAVQDDLLTQMVTDLQTKQDVLVNRNAITTALSL